MLCKQNIDMIELPYNIDSINLVQEFLDKTKERIANGVEITFTAKATSELEVLALEYDITGSDIERTILNLTTENYYRGINPSRKTDFNVCAFRAFIGKEDIEIYLKYGLQEEGLQILLFSNHAPDYPMDQPLKN